MADDLNPTEEQVVETAAANGGPVPEKNVEVTNTYQMIGASRIPVSKSAGPLWKSRRDAASSKIRHEVERWNECMRYFDNDQCFPVTISRLIMLAP